MGVAAPVDLCSLRFGAFQKGRHQMIEDLVYRTIEIRHNGRFAGLQSDAYLNLARNSGGMYLSLCAHSVTDDDQTTMTGDFGMRVYIPFPRRWGRQTILPFPIIDRAVENHGLQCLAHILQLIVALNQAPSKGAPLDIVIPFPDSNLPSDHLVQLLGLCDAIPEQPVTAYSFATGEQHPFRVQAAMLPSIMRNILQRDWVGTAFVNTEGKAGRARIFFPIRGSPLSVNKLPMIQQIAFGRLSVVGLTDIPLTRFGA